MILVSFYYTAKVRQWQSLIFFQKIAYIWNNPLTLDSFMLIAIYSASEIYHNRDYLINSLTATLNTSYTYMQCRFENSLRA